MIQSIGYMQSKTDPLVSIIVPTYNRADLILETLESVKQQTYQNWECIIVDDGSTDETEIVVSDFCKLDSRFRYLRKINGGSATARNIGLKNCVGDFIQFLDDDDYMFPEKLSLSIDKFLRNEKLSVVVTNFKMFTADINSPQPAYCEIKEEYLSLESILFGWDNFFTIPIHCGLFKASLLKDFTYNENVRAKEDWIMWISVFLKGAVAQYSDSVLVLYRNHANSKTKNLALITDNIHKTYKHLLDILPSELSLKFSKVLLDRYNDNLKIKQNEVTQLNQKISLILNSGTYKIVNLLPRIKNKVWSSFNLKDYPDA